MQLRLNSPLRWLSRGLLGWQASFCLPRWLALLGCMALMPVAAQPSTQALTQRCWADSSVWRTRPDLREPMSVRIGNLRNGDTVPSPFWLDFGVRGMGIIPAGTAHAAAGHHHVLLDTPLPMSHVDKIPFACFRLTWFIGITNHGCCFLESRCKFFRLCRFHHIVNRTKR